MERTDQSATHEHPVEQMKLMHEEINRARLSTGSRITSFHTRAAILVSASGIYTALRPVEEVNSLSVAGTVLFVVAAILGLAALWPKRRHEVDPGGSLDAMLVGTPFRVEEAITRSNADALKSDMKLAEELSLRVRWGYLALVLAWVSSYTSAFIG